VAGAHRGKPDNSGLIVLAAVITVPAALIGSLIYLGLKHPNWLYLLLIAAESVVVVQSTHRLVLNLAKQQAQTVQEVMKRLSLYAQLAGTAGAALASIGFVLHWMSKEAFSDSAIGLALVYVVGLPAYRFGGKRMLIAWLRARGFSSEPEA
jgi:hypothetical protein